MVQNADSEESKQHRLEPSLPHFTKRVRPLHQIHTDSMENDSMRGFSQASLSTRAPTAIKEGDQSAPKIRGWGCLVNIDKPTERYNLCKKTVTIGKRDANDISLTGLFMCK